MNQRPVQGICQLGYVPESCFFCFFFKLKDGFISVFFNTLECYSPSEDMFKERKLKKKMVIKKVNNGIYICEIF